MENQLEDQDSLISNQRKKKITQQKNILLKFSASKLLPFLWIFIMSSFISTNVLFLFVLFFVIVEVWLCRRNYSYQLVGLTWSLDSPEIAKTYEDMIKYSIEPDPFVPRPFDSNIFWGLLVGSVGGYLLMTIYYLFQFCIIAFFLLAIIDFIEITNAILYLRCLAKANKQSEDNFKAVMIDTVHQEFQDAIPVIDDDEETHIPQENPVQTIANKEAIKKEEMLPQSPHNIPENESSKLQESTINEIPTLNTSNTFNNTNISLQNEEESSNEPDINDEINIKTNESNDDDSDNFY